MQKINYFRKKSLHSCNENALGKVVTKIVVSQLLFKNRGIDL